MKAIIVPLLICFLAQTSWPVSMVFSKYDLMANHSSVFIAGVLCLILSALGPILVLRYHISNVDPLMYVISVFAWTSMLALGISLELDGCITNFIGYYLSEGEPYIKTGYGTAINYWDGTVHFLLYLVILGLYTARKSHREAGLYWAGSILNSLIVLVPGAITGDHPFKMPILLNIPYVLLPLLSVFKFFNERPPQSRTFYKFKSIWCRPLDMLFILYFLVAFGFSAFRGLAASGGNAEAMENYIKNTEPYIGHPSNFSRIQMFVYEYCFSAYYMAAIYGLIYPGKHWMADWSLLHAGAAAQSQFSYMMGSVHHLTANAFQNPVTGTHGLICWTINIALFIVPQLFALYSFTDVEKFGRTYNVERAELKVSKVYGQEEEKCKKS